MPELPEVETIVRGLQSRLIGRTITRVELKGHPVFKGPFKKFSHSIETHSIQSIVRHGKAIFLSLGSSTLRIHLGMTGQLILTHPTQLLAKHTHLIFHFDSSDDQLRYVDIRRFGNMRIIPSKMKTPLAPDAWKATDQELFSALKKKSGMIKHVLLNQNVIAGLGNIYVDESLFQAKIHPRSHLVGLSDEKLKVLCEVMRKTLKRSIELGGTSFRNYVDLNGGRGGFKGDLLVYGKQGLPCHSCKRTIKKSLVAGRGTHFCPGCQKIKK